MVKLGFMAFANNSGLGIQSKRLVEMLKPDRLLVIDSRSFSQNKELNLDWYKDYQFFTTARGFPSDTEIDRFLDGLTHVFILENPYNFYLPYRAKQLGIKVICQVNYEFCENIEKPYLPQPDIFLMPSYWMINEMKRLFPDVRYLPPPINPDEFMEVRKINMIRTGKPRFLHIIGTAAYKDRNGTLGLLEAVKLTKSDFELIIKTQHELTGDYFLDDPRITYDITNVGENAELYRDFDAMILPRRYGGLSLTTNEALMAGLPVIMPNISPNNNWLPKEWLVEAEYKTQIVVKAIIDVYSVKEKELANKIDWLCSQDLSILKNQAFITGALEFEVDVLKPLYLDLLNNR